MLVVILSFATNQLLLNGQRPIHDGRGGGSSDLYSPIPAYDSFHSLKGNSTIVVLGTVGNIVTAYRPVSWLNITITVFQFNVLSYVKGSGPQSVYVEDTAREGSPLLLTGNDYVLFLSGEKQCPPSPPSPCPSTSPTPPSVTYIPTGGPQAKFLVQNGLVYGFRTLYPQQNLWIKVDANGVLLQQFMAEIIGA